MDKLVFSGMACWKNKLVIYIYIVIVYCAIVIASGILIWKRFIV